MREAGRSGIGIESDPVPGAFAMPVSLPLGPVGWVGIVSHRT